jgi:nitroimidazol reductase NimA-like FMN-containing flavoprotein (pyridoxamine 5'-phosphate oxidase superfamily)/GNAT superfamily N-acetyltransferase
MRRSEFAMSKDDALAFLAAQATFQLAGVTPEGAPVLRTLHGVVIDDLLVFHSAPKGEKTSLLDRPVVAACEETVAVVPSTFFDPVRACPATTYYRSVQVHGVLRELEEPTLKARALQALMDKLQPSGGYRPITHGDPLYRAQVNGLLVAGLSLREFDGKAKLAQNRKPHEIATLLDNLWRRGDDGDPRAIERVRAANPLAPAPGFLTGPAGTTLHAWLPPEAASDVAALLEGTYWNEGIGPERLAQAQLRSPAWVGARDDRGALIGSARAISDGSKCAWVYDVIVAPSWRRRGLASALMRLILDHPAVRGAARVMLATRDAQDVYRPFGFVEKSARPRPFLSVEMVLERIG